MPKGWVVHHLNGDHSDDRVDNLVALPKDMHDGYHTFVAHVHNYQAWLQHAERLLFELGERQQHSRKPCSSTEVFRNLRDILERKFGYH